MIDKLTTVQWMILAATMLAGTGMWLLMPGRGHRARMLGGLLALVALGLFGAQVPRFGAWFSESVFLVLATVTVVSAAATVSFRNPVYCAIWFAMTLLGTSGLFLFQGAQFLAVATIVVYAGAILVTFLFVLMVANPKGRAYYDRVSWESLLSASLGAVLVGVLTLTLAAALTPQEGKSPLPQPTAEARQAEILAPQHMAHLGAQLFSRNLIGVEVAGTLLLVALVGAVALLTEASPRHRTTEGPRHG